jgi:cysteine-rich repeat protein
MRHIIALGVLPFLACTIIIGNRQPIPCDGSEPRCDGDVLVQCTQDIVIKKECAQNSCDLVGLSCEDLCGNGQPDADEACDDGNGNANTPDACRLDCTLPSCGDGITDPGRGEECDPPGAPFCDDDCQEISTCGDGFINGNEECDDSNVTSNDGCALCVLEADIFVRCDNAALGGSGTLEEPFSRLFEAIVAANTNDRIMILPGSLACAGAMIDKSVSLFGLADPTAANLPPRPVIDGGQSSALNVNTLTNPTVIIRDLNLQSSNSVATVRASNNAKVALLRTSITNSNGAAIDCTLSDGGQLLLDQSEVTNNLGGGLIVRGFCRAVLANSFFQNNGSNQMVGTIDMQGNNAHVDVLLSTFDSNIIDSGQSVMRGCASGRGRLDSSIINNNNGNNAIGNNCLATFTNNFGATTTGQGNLNEDPRFASDFSLEADSPCIDAANPNNFVLLFNPQTVFGINVFGHDFAGGVRPVGVARDMGMLEVQ